MTKSIGSFLAHLRNTHSKQLPKSNVLKVVYGNQSADFDSVMSALAYAYCSYQRNPDDILVPIIGISRQELSLRRDVTRALARVNVEEDHLFFLEDMRLLKEKYHLIKAVLVDHNQLEPGAKDYVDQVVGVIDHHKDAGLYPEVEPRIIRTAGSCSSLVINYWRKKVNDPSVIKDAALLCLGAGIIDTSNFTHRVEDPDLQAFQFYRALFPEIDTDSLYKQIRYDKDDLDGMSIAEILKKDYKEFDFRALDGKHLKVGIASAVKPLSWFYQTFNGESTFQQECYEVQKQKNVDVFIVMTAWMNGSQFERELVILSPLQETCQAILAGISRKLDLEEKTLTSFSAKSPMAFKAFQQRNISASRKQVAPYVKDAIERSYFAKVA
ncbi:hypothetical protein HG536_0C06400 [Torulaspora globosa]|uniref:DHHA2 domain-containing protein n=1 Tax=Torulaspora globosa TaxID=48254 RepID=A0A7G3ZG35_9SACH|nr:uncharacterized protein HG536_0C06400 [Torulaspora globosa]QLL32471.1 hypothetical protein HG536_0C06400 [Torulaspora globosa]